MLKIISAPPGGGKTTHIYEQLRSAIEENSAETAPKQLLLCSGESRDLTRPIIIVPEQFHFETEHILYKKLGARLIGGIEITSFTKLSSDINGIYGKMKPYADRTAREITMLRVLTRLGGNHALRHYTAFNSKTGVRPDIAPKILGVIEEFQKAGVSPADLEEIYGKTVSDGGINRLHLKMYDLAMVYKAYSGELGEEFSDRSDDITKAAELSRVHGYFKNREIFIDSFDGFSGSQLKLVKAILSDCRSLSLTITADKIPSEEAPYQTSSLLAERLKKLARETRRKHEIVNLSERLLFPPRNPSIQNPFIAPDVYAECNYVAAKIRELVTKENYTFNEIMVLARGRDFLPALNSALNTYGISAFMDIPAPVIEKPFVRFLITALEAALLKPEKLMLYIKSGFVRVNAACEQAGLKSRGNLKTLKMKTYSEYGGENERYKAVRKSVRLSRRTISRLEEASIKWRLRSRDWRNEFPEGDSLLRMLEPVRKEIIFPLLEFGEKLKNATGSQITEALADFLINKLEIQRTILNIVNRRTAAFKKGFSVNRELNDEYRQLWETIITVLEAMHAALLDYPISAEDYGTVLISVLSKTEIAKPPQVLDAVTVGDIERSRTGAVKVAFVMGANRGVFPKSQKIDGEFSADELEELLRAGVTISENRTERYFREKFIVNKTLFLPSERLYISAPLSGLSWNPLDPADLLYALAKEHNLKCVSTEDFPVSFWASTPEAARNTLAQSMDKPAVRKALTECIPPPSGSEPDFIALFEAARGRRVNSETTYLHKIDGKAAAILMETKTLSPSGIELLNNCRFKYFCEYGLRIRVPNVENDITLNQLQRGNLIHYCLYRALSDNAFSIDNFTPPLKTEVLARQYIDEFVEKELLSGYARTKRQKEILSSYQYGIERILNALQMELKFSDFKPRELEKSFSYKLSELEIKGKTDRYDTFSDSGQIFVRVIDYKTGKHVFNYPAIYYGLGLQSLLYLFGALENNPGWLPSGAYYYSENIGYKTDSIIPDTEKITPSEQEKIMRWAEGHRHSGIQFTGAEPDALDMEKLENAVKNAAGCPNSRKKLIERNFVSRSEYGALKDYIGDLLKRRLNELYIGDIPALPVKDGQRKSCDFCGFGGFCGNNGSSVQVLQGKEQAITNE